MNKLWIVLALVAANAHAENWIEVGLDEMGSAVYADPDSVKRDGDIGTIKIRVGDDPSKQREMVQTYNCPARLATNGSLLLQVDDQTSKPAVLKTFNMACKKWWEIWK
ncbi:hypothetical protein BH11PSE11_BH11PSE11_19890 [soil metagenome]